jgi:hypothetical protein
MRRCIIQVAAVFIFLTLAGCRSKAKFESEFVHHEKTDHDKSGAIFTQGMTYKNGTKPDRGWDGERIVVGVEGGEAEFVFTFVGCRESKDVYRVARSFPLGDDSVKTMAVEIAYEGREIILFDDDLGKASLRPGHPNKELKATGEPAP